MASKSVKSVPFGWRECWFDLGVYALDLVSAEAGRVNRKKKVRTAIESQSQSQTERNHGPIGWLGLLEVKRTSNSSFHKIRSQSRSCDVTYMTGTWAFCGPHPTTNQASMTGHLLHCWARFPTAWWWHGSVGFDDGFYTILFTGLYLLITLYLLISLCFLLISLSVFWLLKSLFNSALFLN